jgi:hypothetical protein
MTTRATACTAIVLPCSRRFSPIAASTQTASITTITKRAYTRHAPDSSNVSSDGNGISSPKALTLGGAEKSSATTPVNATAATT